MVEAGYVANVKEAFNLYLRKDGPAYVPKEKLTALDGLQLIRHFGGLPVLAHPQTLEFERFEDLADFVTTLKDQGLAGIEAYYQGQSEHIPPLRRAGRPGRAVQNRRQRFSRDVQEQYRDRHRTGHRPLALPVGGGSQDPPAPDPSLPVPRAGQIPPVAPLLKAFHRKDAKDAKQSI